MSLDVPTSGRRTLVAVVLPVVAVLAVYGALESWRVSAEYARQYPDAYGAAGAEERFAPLIARVPADAELGYFTDLETNSPAAKVALLAARYAAAPRLLLPLDAGTAPERAVGNFSKPQDYAAAGAARGYAVEADLGNGVVLFRKAGAR